MLWAIDETRPDGVLAVEYPYFETAEPLVWEEDGTYVATDASFQHTVTHSWNHGLAEVVTAVMSAGLELTMLQEHDSVPWNALPGRMARDEHDEYRLTERTARLPCTYTLQARKPG
jgi:hypothetical protein